MKNFEKIAYKVFPNKKCTRFYPSAFSFLNELVTTAATAVVVVEASAKEKDYDKDNNPRRTIATVIATATHSQTSLRFSKSYYEKQKEVLQFSKCNDLIYYFISAAAEGKYNYVFYILPLPWRVNYPLLFYYLRFTPAGVGRYSLSCHAREYPEKAT